MVPPVAPDATFDLAALFRRVDEQRVVADQSWASVSRETRVSSTTVRRLATARDAEADGVLALIGWLGAVPEEFIVGGIVAGEPLPQARGGFVRVASGRTSIQSLVTAAQTSGRSIASFTAWRPG